MPDLVPLQQAAGEFGVNPASLYRYLKRGKLTRYRRELDQKTYIDRAELRALLEFRPAPLKPEESEP